MLDLVAAEHGCTRLSLDDAENLKAARLDPAAFAAEPSTPVFIDEVQRGGERLVLAIKSEVDRRHRESGLFVLAGSSRFLTVPTLAESLAGRARFVDLWPLIQAEVDGVTPDIVSALFAGPVAVRGLGVPAADRAVVMRRIALGGFPAVHRLASERSRATWFDDYVRTLVLRDLTELSRIRQAADLPRLVRLIAARTAGELNVADLARDSGLNVDTLRSYLALLETIYMHHSVRGWSTNTTSRAVRRPKLHMVDTGLAASLVGVSAASLTSLTSPHAGPLFETFVVGEMIKLLPGFDRIVDLYHYRSGEGQEIDLILEARDGSIVGIEVKAARSVDDGDVRHLARLRDRLGDRFINGVLIHLGTRPVPLGDRLTALPVTALWS